MDRALKVPVVDYSYEDCRLMSKAQRLGLPPFIGLVEVQKIREEFGYIERTFVSQILLRVS